MARRPGGREVARVAVVMGPIVSNRVNIGCGRTPIAGWRNYDNSVGVWLGRSPTLLRVARTLRLLDRRQLEFAQFAGSADIEWADGARRIPAAAGSVEVLYSCHMLEHLSREAAQRFVRLAHEVLAPGGLLRIAVPDLKHHVGLYLADGDADAFMRRTLLGKENAPGLLGRLKLLLLGERHHQWMYDGASLCSLLRAAGFERATVLPAGVTEIENPVGLDLAERAPESVFVEARKRGR